MHHFNFSLRFLATITTYHLEGSFECAYQLAALLYLCFPRTLFSTDTALDARGHDH